MTIDINRDGPSKKYISKMLVQSIFVEQIQIQKKKKSQEPIEISNLSALIYKCKPNIKHVIYWFYILINGTIFND